jgi:hypothetical protein
MRAWAVAAIIAFGISAATARSIDWPDAYNYIVPAGWSSRAMGDHIRLESPGGSCVILIFPIQQSAADLQQAAVSVLDTMYKGWQFQRTGPQSFTLYKGVLPSGQDFFMMEAGMKKLAADGTRYDGFEDGAAFIVQAPGGYAIVAARHNASLLGHSDCRKYDRWPRFVNSFSVKNAPVTAAGNDAARIVGRWVMSESGAVGEYLFAANGNYAIVGALGSTYKTSDANYDYLHVKTNAFAGDGSYSIAGKQLLLRRRGGAAEQIAFRFDEVNHGGAGWSDRLVMRKRDGSGENEVAYERVR